MTSCPVERGKYLCMVTDAYCFIMITAEQTSSKKTPNESVVSYGGESGNPPHSRHHRLSMIDFFTGASNNQVNPIPAAQGHRGN